MAFLISIHALREEGDSLRSQRYVRLTAFLSTPSARRATRQRRNARGYQTVFLSTPSARRATYIHALAKDELNNFYPRPPRGGRRIPVARVALDGLISIHALREEGDTINQLRQAFQIQFLSTPSARRAT